MEIEYTRVMEAALYEIAERKQAYLAVVTAATQELEQGLKKL